MGKMVSFPYFQCLKELKEKKQRLSIILEIDYCLKNRLWKIFTSHLSNFNNKSKTSILNVSELATIFHIPERNSFNLSSH